MLSSKNVLMVALLGALPSMVYANADDGLGEVVVTATRLAQPLNQSLSSTTVITEQDIRNSQAADVTSILRTVAGVEIAQSGGMGKTSSIFLRGTESTHALVLIDGVRVNSATYGTTEIEQLMPDQIERIEVVRGNASSLYGSEAIGGVIQIFTRHGRGKPKFNVSAGVGNQATRRASAGYGGAVDGTDFSVQATSFRTDGVSAMNSALNARVNPDLDGYRNNSLSANVGHAFNADHRISASLFGSYGENKYDNAYNAKVTDANSSQSQIWKSSLSSDDQISEAWHSKLQLADGVDQYRDFRNGQPTSGGSLIQTRNDQLTWQNELRLDEDQQLLLGAETLRQKVTSDKKPSYAQDTRTINSFFAGYTGIYGQHQAQLNLRRDNNSQYGGKTTGLLGYGYVLTDAWRATASYSTAFKAPTFNELYFPNYGNPGLKPERSRNREAGLHYAAGKQLFDAVYFDNRIEDMINWAFVGGSYLPQNVNSARMTGLELSYADHIGDTGVKAALTSQNPRNDNTGVQLDRRAKLHSSLGLSQQFGDWQLGGEWLYSGERPDTSNTKTLPAYHVFNLTLGYAIDKNTTVSARTDNLTNQNDSNAYGFNPLGRRLFVSVRYQPQD